MKYTVSLLLSLLLGIAITAQTPISGIINTYATVEAIDDCQQTLTLGTVASNGDLAPLDTVLIVQMQGAAVNTDNNASFGEITDLNGAGYYEKAVIADIQVPDIMLERPLLNNYETAGKVQLVSIPYYESAEVIDSLQAEPWNGALGGVLALHADTLTLSGRVDVSALGFRGGNQLLDYDGDCLWFINHTDYAYEEGSIRGGRKGEGIVLLGTGLARGRGPAANGGGGGNDHNSGGGGGGSVSGGGQGGDNNNPSIFGCQGDFPGIGGRGLPLDTTRLFMGGGGGAGHINNIQSTDQANGGGIVLIETQLLFNNGFPIQANGADALTKGGDGANGGGAGGTIVLLADEVTGEPLVVEAQGGRGGDANNLGTDQCFGPGGGGAGGLILASASLTYTPSLSGGSNGITFNSTECGVGSNGAQAGNDGQQNTLHRIPQNLLPNQDTLAITDITTDATGCVGHPLTLSTQVTGGSYTAQWQINTGSGFEDLTETPPYSMVNSDSLVIAPLSEEIAGYQFRLVVFSDCLASSTSESVSVQVLVPPPSDFDFTVDDLSVSFTAILPDIGSEYQWDFGDGNGSTLPDPVHTYASGGSYEVTLTVTNDCGSSVIIQQVQVGTPAVPQFEVVGNFAGCPPLQVTFENTSLGDYSSLEWSFPGGDPATATTEMSTVLYSNAGSYDVTLTVFDGFGATSTTSTGLVQVFQRPTPSFTSVTDGLTVTFTNLSANATDYNWNFGDGSTSTEENPVHTYTEPGNYDVTLNAGNSTCNAAAVEQVLVGTSNTNAITPGSALYVYPNPTSGPLYFANAPASYSWQLINVNGQQVQQGTQAGATSSIDLQGLPSGLYYLRVADATGRVFYCKVLLHS